MNPIDGPKLMYFAEWKDWNCHLSMARGHFTRETFRVQEWMDLDGWLPVAGLTVIRRTDNRLYSDRSMAIAFLKSEVDRAKADAAHRVVWCQDWLEKLATNNQVVAPGGGGGM